MKKILALVLSLFLMLSCVSFASAEGKKIADIYYGGGTPLSIDPALVYSQAGANINKLAFSGLMGYSLIDGEPKLAPELAESYTVSEDGLTYTFELREGLKWSDGSDFKASDVMNSWQRACSDELGADCAFLFDYVERDENGDLNITADDEARIFTAKLAAPTAYFLNLCAFPTFYPVKAELADNEGIWATKPETYIGTGPFRMTKYAVDNVIAFERNPYYWNADAVKLDGANCWLSEDNVAILTAYESGNAHFIGSIDPVEYSRLDTAYPGELVMGPSLGIWYLLFNVHTDISPADKTLTVQEQSDARRALGMLVNRQELVDYVIMGGQMPATGFFPAGLSDGLNSDVRAAEGYGSWYTGTAAESAVNADLTEDQVEALNILIDLGYAYTGSIEGGDIAFSDFPIIELSYFERGANAAIMQYIQEIWNRFGITGTINQEAFATLQVKFSEGDAEATCMSWGADFDDCVNFLEIFISNGSNYARLGRDAGSYTRFTEVTKDAGLGAYWGLDGDQTWAECYDSLVNEIKACQDPAERAAKCAQAEKILMATGAVSPMYFSTNPYMLKPTVSDLIILPTGDVIWTYADIA